MSAIKTKPILFVCLLVSAFVLSGCASVYVTNTSSRNSAVVKFKVPDSSGYEVAKLGASNTVGEISWVGGTYSVVVVPNEPYLAALNSLRNKIETDIFLHATTIQPDDLFALLDELKSLQREIDRMSIGAACAGHVGDYADVTAVVHWDDDAQKWTAVCPSVRSSSKGE